MQFVSRSKIVSVLFLVLSCILFAQCVNIDDLLYLQGEKLISEGIKALGLHQYENAKMIFLKCLEEGHLYGMTFGAIKNSFLIMYISRLIKTRPEYKGDFTKHIQHMINRAKKGDLIPHQINHLSNLAVVLNCESLISNSFNEVLKVLTNDSQREAWTSQSYDSLYKCNYFQEIVDNFDLVENARKQLEILEKTKINGKTELVYTAMIEMAREKCIQYEMIYRTLGDKEKKDQITEFLQKIDSL